jgi:hypothetical protein
MLPLATEVEGPFARSYSDWLAMPEHSVLRVTDLYIASNPLSAVFSSCLHADSGALSMVGSEHNLAVVSARVPGCRFDD